MTKQSPAAITRRQVRDPEMIRRIQSAMVRAAASVHRRRLREWAASDEGTFPSEADSQRIAVAEVEYLIRALDGLAGLGPEKVFGPDRRGRLFGAP